MARTHLDEILQIIAKPGGFAKLSGVQRKFLMGLVLAAIVPADKRIRNVEMERLHILLKSSLRADDTVAIEVLAMAEGLTELAPSVDRMAKALPELLGIEDRSALISQLWELALCDHELHVFEEQLVYQVADLSGVPRKKVAELMARAAAQK
jgi:uncharacterized tellurite resistance protein B-like protein